MLSAISLLITTITLVAFLAACFFVFRSAFSSSGLPKSIAFVIIFGIALRALYISYTDFQERTHDIRGHAAYIVYINKNFELPNDDACDECFQPPVYYLLSAQISRLFESYFANPAAAIELQLLSLALSTIFLVYSALFLAEFISSKKSLIIAVSLVTLWPSGILYSSMVGNDLLLYPLFSACIYYLTLWYKNDKSKYFSLAILISIISFYTKGTGIILMGLIVLAYVYKCFVLNSLNISSIRNLLLLGGLFGIVVGYAYFPSIKEYISDSGPNYIARNSLTLNKKLWVNNGPENYLYFSIETFLKQPFSDPWIDGSGRQYFWNHWLKTSLLGEFASWFDNDGKSSNTNTSLSYIISFLALCLILYMLFGLLSTKSKEIPDTWIILTGFFALVLAAIGFRWSLPTSGSADFKYVYPIVIFAAYYFTSGLEKLQQQRLILLAYGAYTSATLFIFFVILFFLINTPFIAEKLF